MCFQLDRDRLAAIICPVVSENYGFIGYPSTSNAFGEDIVSEWRFCARVCVGVFVCVTTAHGQ